MNKLEGKIALITGGNSGIGLTTAKQFVNEGAYVFVTGRREPELAAAVKEIRRNVTGVQGDVSNLADLDRLFAQIKQEKGKLVVTLSLFFASVHASERYGYCTDNLVGGACHRSIARSIGYALLLHRTGRSNFAPGH